MTKRKIEEDVVKSNSGTALIRRRNWAGVTVYGIKDGSGTRWFGSDYSKAEREYERTKGWDGTSTGWGH